MLKAVTPAQREFIELLKQEYADFDITFGDHEEWVAIAISADACETFILSHHMIERYSIRRFVATSPLITEIMGESSGELREGTISGMVQSAVTGTSYLCPADHPQ